MKGILNDLRLNNIADSIIGNLGSGLSLEQRKRVNIAVELAANPDMIISFSILFIDLKSELSIYLI